MSPEGAPPPDSGPIRILIVADDPLARHGLASLLAGAGGIRHAGESAPEAAHRFARELRPDAVLWDLGVSAAAQTAALSETAELAPVVTLLSDDGRASAAIGAGARGCLARASDSRRLAAALQAVALGLHVLDEGAAVAALRPGAQTPEPLLEPLTPREREVLELLSLGWTNKTIARRLNISDHTAKFHVNSLLSKLGVESRTEAVVRAARLGLVTL